MFCNVERDVSAARNERERERETMLRYGKRLDIG